MDESDLREDTYYEEMVTWVLILLGYVPLEMWIAIDEDRSLHALICSVLMM